MFAGMKRVVARLVRVQTNGLEDNELFEEFAKAARAFDGPLRERSRQCNSDDHELLQQSPCLRRWRRTIMV